MDKESLENNRKYWMKVKDDFDREFAKLEAEITAELNVEQDAMQDYFERTGTAFQNLEPVAQRKIIENYKEDHQ